MAQFGVTGIEWAFLRRDNKAPDAHFPSILISVSITKISEAGRYL